jgi:hypothetical protein
MNISWPFVITARHRVFEEHRIARWRRREVTRRAGSSLGMSGSGSLTVVIQDPRDPRRLAARTNDLLIRSIAWLIGPVLDRQLASGRPPESGRALATRAIWIVLPTTRRELAQNWDDLLFQVRRPPRALDHRVPLCRDRILACESDVKQMVKSLAISLPLSAKGVAMAKCLITDGSGPLYNRDCADDLRGALTEILSHLDPTVPLAAPA